MRIGKCPDRIVLICPGFSAPTVIFKYKREEDANMIECHFLHTCVRLNTHMTSSTDDRRNRCFVDRSRISLIVPHQGGDWSSSSATALCPQADGCLGLWKMSRPVMASHF